MTAGQVVGCLCTALCPELLVTTSNICPRGLPTGTPPKSVRLAFQRAPESLSTVSHTCCELRAANLQHAAARQGIAVLNGHSTTTERLSTIMQLPLLNSSLSASGARTAAHSPQPQQQPRPVHPCTHQISPPLCTRCTLVSHRHATVVGSWCSRPCHKSTS